jgi:predicted dehydrogenase
MKESRTLSLSRRELLRRASHLAGGVTLPYLLPSGVLAAPGRAGANDRIGLGVIGPGRRAQQLLSDMASAPSIPSQCRVVAACDVWLKKCHEYLEAYEAKVLKQSGGKYAIHQDYRKLLDARDVDAVVVATPEHWRALICVHACQAGKDVYAEKPLCLTVHEGRMMVQAARKYQRVFQTGTQQRSMARNRHAAELVRNGRLGKLHTVVCQNWQGPRPYRDFTIPAESIPEGLDWDRWCGPTEPVPFSTRVYLTYNNPGWHGIQTYSGGWLANAGSHALDMVQWALDADGSGPVEVWAEKPSFLSKVTFRYANGVLLKLEQAGDADRQLVKSPGLELASCFGAIFYGDKGFLVMHRGRFNTRPISIPRNRSKRATSIFARAIIISRTGSTVSARANSRPPTWKSATAPARCATWPTSRAAPGAGCAGIRSRSYSSATPRPTRCSIGPSGQGTGCPKRSDASRGPGLPLAVSHETAVDKMTNVECRMTKEVRSTRTIIHARNRHHEHFIRTVDRVDLDCRRRCAAGGSAANSRAFRDGHRLQRSSVERTFGGRDRGIAGRSPVCVARG